MVKKTAVSGTIMQQRNMITMESEKGSFRERGEVNGKIFHLHGYLTLSFFFGNNSYRVSDNDFGKARGRNPSKAYI